MKGFAHYVRENGLEELLSDREVPFCYINFLLTDNAQIGALIVEKER